MACQTDFNTTIDATGNITCKRADTFKLKFQVTHEDDDSPHDLTQYDRILMHVKVTAKDAEYILAFDTDAVDTFVVDPPNMFTLFQEAEDMKLEAKGYVYDAEGWIGDERITLFSGNFTVTDDVTRAGDIPTP